ncbi:hypothetical protein PV773_24405 [Mesorhizobium sp. CC13]|uniref:hypothetical protein n=1 Tax=Mesorhizobium sp. CC13 TaxID=3029194 RepID=UPI0032631CEF
MMHIHAALLRHDYSDPAAAFEGAKKTESATSHFEPPTYTRRRFTGMLATAAMLSWTNRVAAGSLTDQAEVPGSPATSEYPLFEEASAKVLPPNGYLSSIALKDSIVRLVRQGVLDQGKFLGLRQRAGKGPDKLADALSEPLNEPIHLTGENANDYVNLLWPIGLANHMEGNVTSPLFTVRLPSFSSTAGWTLGDHNEGSVYFNKFSIVEMTQAEEALAIRLAKSTFRPCCNNSTFFQDCNHGSALLGVLQLGASQGLSEADLYREALAFNSFWFPDYYVRTALYVKIVRRQEWEEVDPKEIMSEKFSAQGPWQQNVQTALETMPDLIPKPRKGANCGVSARGAVLYRRTVR